jgi:hypothetical protein
MKRKEVRVKRTSYDLPPEIVGYLRELARLSHRSMVSQLVSMIEQEAQQKLSPQTIVRIQSEVQDE